MASENIQTCMITPQKGDMIHQWNRGFYLERDGESYVNCSQSLDENGKRPIKMIQTSLEDIEKFKLVLYQPKR